MTSIVFILNDILKRSRALWYGTVILFVIAFFVRLTPLFVKNGYIVYFINMAALFIAILLCILILFNVVDKMFPGSFQIKHESIFYKRFGLSLLGQFFIKTAILVLFLIFLFSIVSVIVWSWEFKYLLFGFSLCMFFIVMRSLSVMLNINYVYYLAILFVIISMIYPLYILPNMAYVVKSGSYKVIIYLLTYGALYFFTAFKLFYFSWRQECIGWMY
ncbi:MAG: hypothetical protein NTY22_00480 [Proteobacteria bacterium]|nr:hypothetical protein [Pseudomonadota bacterium]